MNIDVPLPRVERPSLPSIIRPSLTALERPSLAVLERPSLAVLGRCISYVESPENRCELDVVYGRKYCEQHLKLLPKKAYHDLDDIDIDQILTPEMGVATLMDLYIKTQKVIDLRDSFIEKFVSLECRDRGHRLRRYLLVTFQQRCEDVLQQIYQSWEIDHRPKPTGRLKVIPRSDPSPKEVPTTLKKSYEKSKKAFKATKKRTQDWGGEMMKEINQNREIVEGREELYAEKINHLAGELPNGPITPDHISKLGSFFREIYPPKPKKIRKRREDNQPLRYRVSTDLSVRTDPALFRTLWRPIISSCCVATRVNDMNLFEDFLEQAILPLISRKKMMQKNKCKEFFESVSKTPEGSIKTDWWEFIAEVYASVDFIIVHTCPRPPKPCGCYDNLSKTFYFVTLFGTEPSFWFINQGYDDYSCQRLRSVKELDRLDSPMSMEASQVEALRWCKPFNLVKVSWTLIKRIMISAKLGMRGFEMIRKDMDEYDQFRRDVMR